jgi:hypothetical protein
MSRMDTLAKLLWSIDFCLFVGIAALVLSLLYATWSVWLCKRLGFPPLNHWFAWTLLGIGCVIVSWIIEGLVYPGFEWIWSWTFSK